MSFVNCSFKFGIDSSKTLSHDSFLVSTKLESYSFAAVGLSEI